MRSMPCNKAGPLLQSRVLQALADQRLPIRLGSGGAARSSVFSSGGPCDRWAARGGATILRLQSWQGKLCS